MKRLAMAATGLDLGQFKTRWAEDPAIKVFNSLEGSGHAQETRKTYPGLPVSRIHDCFRAGARNCCVSNEIR